MASNKRRNSGAGIGSRIVTVVCLCVLLVGALYLGYSYYRNVHAEEVNEQLRNLYRRSSEEMPTLAPDDAETERIGSLRTTFTRASEALEETRNLSPMVLLSAFDKYLNHAQDLPDVYDIPVRPTVTPVAWNTPVPATESPADTPVPAVDTPVPSEEPATAEPVATVEPTAVPTEAPTVEPTATPFPEGAHVLREDFEGLYEINDHVIGWITTGGNVDYPVLWKENDNDFYMTHDFNRDSDSAGSIFLDKRNVPEMTDDELLVYGHNMRSGAMFGDLDMYRDEDYLKANPMITLQNAYEGEPRKYVYFSMFDASMNSGDRTYIKITQFNFDTPEAKQEYIDTLLARSMYEMPIDVNADDQIVTLVTCSYSNDNGRFLLTGRALREGETEEEIRKLFAEWEN